MKNFILFAIFIIIFPQFGNCNLTLPSIFSDHMVLKANEEVKIWGWGKPGENVILTSSWDKENKYETKANTSGQWELSITTSSLSGPQSIVLKGFNEITISDILLGEVWLCSGQSNMEWSPSMKIEHADREIPKANFPQIRLFTVSTRTAMHPQEDLKGSWVICTPETMKDFSAIGYFFGKELHENLGSPVGMIMSAWGGTPAEIWMDKDSIQNDVILASSAKKLRQEPWGPKDPGLAYNAMIHPLAPFRITGALWYQGETNVQNADSYARLLSRLIENWRDLWGYDFPFYYAQIAPFTYGADNINGAVVRDQQRRVLDFSNETAMVVISDIGDLTDIHPRNKIDVAKRFANIALHSVYSKQEIETNGPLYNFHTTFQDKIIVHFKHANSGLVAEGEIKYFEIAGEDHSFYPATAKIDGSTVILNSTKVSEPIFVRFAMTNTATPNLFNKDGLPTSCFTSEDKY